ncbi:hypothetical protein A3L09_10270 [Thermococcus profundus]|uniref:Uncharacterized protein n=1 Tax=Thermococcus profundus TaxID=49899 RepID=A0A2Z2MCN3_THEPR|nr:hypothetical protein [Thermococcus profundus]ASJ03616.1 hypothetical protein A3L09_10270 [Thermococcus profundus]
MRFEVLSKEDMNALSRELSRAGIMNRKVEEVSHETAHYILIRGRYGEIFKNAEEIEPVEEILQNLGKAYDKLIMPLGLGEEISEEEFLSELEVERLILLTALIEANAAEENNGRIKLLKKPKLEDLIIELRFPVEELEEYLDILEEKFDVKMLSEVSMVKNYYVDVLEVDRELIEQALEVAEEYATEESYVEAMFIGIARSILAETILNLAEKYRRKDELIKALLEGEPVAVEGENERIYVYFDEDAIESFLKELQSLGYIKVKGNRIWA